MKSIRSLPAAAIWWVCAPSFAYSASFSASQVNTTPPIIENIVTLRYVKWDPIFYNKSGAIARVVLTDDSGSTIEFMTHHLVEGVACLDLADLPLTYFGSTAVVSIDSGCAIYARPHAQNVKLKVSVLSLIEKSA